MPDGMTGGTLIVVLGIGLAFYGVEKVTHAKPIVKFNHAVCHVVTLGHKCKKQSSKPQGGH